MTKAAIAIPQDRTKPNHQKKERSKEDAYKKMAQKRIYDQIKYLRPRNNDLKEMEYFYLGFQGLYSSYIEELKKKKAEGKKIVGIYCNFVPVELILAADAVPIRMCTGFSDTILSAEEVLPRNFCPLIKSSFGSVLESNPLLNLVDVCVIPTSCDGKKKLTELLAEHMKVWVMEVPHTTNAPDARKLWLREIKEFKKQLQKFTGNRITTRKIKKAIATLNDQRVVVRDLYNVRKDSPAIWGRDVLLATNYISYDEPKRWTAHAEKLVAELKKKPPIPVEGHMPRILITGTPLVMPTWKIPVLIEESGGIIVTDDICTGTKGMWDPVEMSSWTGSDMMISLADRYLMNTCATFTPNTARLKRLKRFVKDWKIEGVIYYVLMACHPYGMEQRKINLEMEKMNIPVLNIETDFSEEDVEQIRTRMEAFIEMIKTRYALQTGTVLDKELHPRGYATKQGGSNQAMTREQIIQKIADAPSKTAMEPEKDFPVEEVRNSDDNYEPSLEKPLDSMDLKPPGTPSNDKQKEPEGKPTSELDPKEVYAKLNVVKEVVLKAENGSEKQKKAKEVLKLAIEQYTQKDYSKALELIEEVTQIIEKDQ